MRIATWLLASIALAACGASGAPEIARQSQTAPTSWQEISPGPADIEGQTITATCSGAPGADPAYSFWVKRGRSDALVVYFDGGGACWNDQTCSQPRLASNPENGFFKAELIASDNPTRLSGIFDLENPRNPVRDWSFVFVPYCTGDVHSGSNTATYTNPATGEDFTIQHRGADNFRVVLEWVRANFDAPAEILVTGSSAGAYGAATHFGRVRDIFPAGRATMLGDAGQGVTTPGFLDQRNGNWRYDLPTSVFGRDAMLTDDDDIIELLAAHYPRDGFAQYTTAHDTTQSGFFALMGVRNACRRWTETMARDLTRRQRAGNFRSYLAAGSTHTILRSPLFYTETSGGAPFSEWFSELLTAADGSQNRGCETCLTDVPHCPF